LNLTISPDIGLFVSESIKSTRVGIVCLGVKNNATQLNIITGNKIVSKQPENPNLSIFNYRPVVS
jgi:hypothetical protein